MYQKMVISEEMSLQVPACGLCMGVEDKRGAFSLVGDMMLPGGWRKFAAVWLVRLLQHAKQRYGLHTYLAKQKLCCTMGSRIDTSHLTLWTYACNYLYLLLRMVCMSKLGNSTDHNVPLVPSMQNSCWDLVICHFFSQHIASKMWTG